MLRAKSIKMQLVYFDARKIEDGGIGTYIQNIIKHLRSKKFVLKLILSHVSCKKYCALQDASPIFLKARNHSFREQIGFLRKIPPCDLFWSPHFNIPLLPIRAKKRLTTIHDLFHFSKYANLSFFEKKLASFLIHQAVKKSDHMITGSYFTKQELLALTTAKESTTTCIHYGVNKELFCVKKNDRIGQQSLTKYELPDRYFLCIGNQKEHKNLRGAFQAFALFLKKTSADIHLVSVGSGRGLRKVDSLETTLGQFPILNGRIHLLGKVESKELPLLYRKASFLLFPSFFEGFGLPPLEAMCCETPVIASNIESIKEVCKEAFLPVDPHNPYSIALAMERLWKEPELSRSLIEKGRERVQHYDWERCAEQHVKLIESII